MEIVPAPALPVVGDTLHHVSARSFMACALHAVDEVNDTVIVPPSVAIIGFVSVPEESSSLSTGFGVGAGVSFSGSLFPHDMVNRDRSKIKNFFVRQQAKLVVVLELGLIRVMYFIVHKLIWSSQS